MASERRPGGLTALAVINFVWGGLSALGALVFLALIPFLGSVLDQAATQDMPPEQRAQIEALGEIGASVFLFILVISIVTAGLLIASGVGYLKLKKFLGRTLGNTYGVVGIVSTLGQALFFTPELGGGFNIMVIAGLIYPVLTLILLNTTFKEDFVN